MFLNELDNMLPDCIAHAVNRSAALLRASHCGRVFQRPFQTPRCAGENRAGTLSVPVAERDQIGHTLAQKRANCFRYLTGNIQPYFIRLWCERGRIRR